MLIVLGGSGLMAVLGPLIGAIADDPVRAVTELRPVVSLFLASTIYAALVLTLMGVAVSLTRGWRLPSRAERAADQATTQASTSAAEAAAAASGRAPPRPAAANDDRVSGIAAAVLRDSSNPATLRVSTLADAAREAAPSAAPEPRRRLEGLGQTFRATPQARALTGHIGS
jgi:type IV secretion system protein VirB6